MKLSQLARGLALTGDLGNDPEVFGVRHDSRTVESGDLFVAWRGARHDGAAFAADAVARGAAAVVADHEPPADFAAGVPWLIAADPRALLGPLAAPLVGHPERALTLAGVTGTNGKSTFVELTAAMLDAARVPCGRIGTLGHHFPGLATPPTGRTTPEGSDLFRLLAAMRGLGAQAVAMEVSSHALDQGRVAGLAFDVAAFTNLTRDHFDYHGDFESYFAAKAKLFAMLKPSGRAVINVDDPWGRKLAEGVAGALSFGERGDVAPLALELDAEGIRGELTTPRGPLAFDSPLLGRYNLANLLAAVAAGEALELPPTAIAAGIAATRPLPGRLEPVDAGQPFPVLIDFAHTPAALEAAIRSTRELSGRPVVLVFGCGGEKDRGKRTPMGELAGRLAELPIATSDNPRSEDPAAILAAIEQGLRDSGNRRYRVVPDRGEAIRRAVAVAAAERWALLVAGKGHERTQEIGTRELPFSDREELERALADRVAERGER
jgi:UDP-N-acetylmuramoyl-L-alanyl-D-glutamate--2,6-diaminopimelate ligase